MKAKIYSVSIGKSAILNSQMFFISLNRLSKFD